MLWPEGSTGILADIGSYLDPPLPDEGIRAFSLSKASSYLAVASAHVIALFRLKPLAPLAIYPALFAETEIVDIVTSARGDNLAVLTRDNRISVFSVQPRRDIEELLRITSIVTPGIGEAIGARELWLEAIGSIYTEHHALRLGSLGKLLIVYSEREVQVATWHSFETRDPLKPPALVPYHVQSLEASELIVGGCSGPWAKSNWVTSVVTSLGRVITLLWTHPESNKLEDGVEELVLEGIEGPVTCIDYNFRMSKLVAVTHTGKIYVVRDISDATCKPWELPTDVSRQPLSVQWTPSGTALLIGYTDGWQLVSMLGLDLFRYRDRAPDTTKPVGVVKAEWMVSAEVAVMLGSDGQVRLQNMLRWSGGLAETERSRPVLHGNGRLMLYHGPSARGVSSNDGPSNQTWLTIPLPTWYMAQNWPIAHISASPDGRFVAVAGTIGIMLFSVATRQWKEVGDRESMVRGGLCWYGRRLVAATVSADDGTTSLKMFSPVTGSHTKSVSGMSSGLFGTQFLAPKRESVSSASTGGTGLAHGSHAGHAMEHRPSAHDLLNEPGLHASLDMPGHANGASHAGPGGSPLSPSSPLMGNSPNHSTIGIASLGASNQEQQVVAKDVLGKGVGSLVSLMAKGPGGLLAVLAGADLQRLLVYDLSKLEFDLVKDIPLAGVLAGIKPAPVVRALSLVSETKVLVLAGTTLLLVSSVDEDNRKYHRQVVAEPIESFEYLASEEQLWVFDGQEAVVTRWSPTLYELPPDRQNKYVASVQLDAYPVHFSAQRGVVSLVEAESVRSFDGSFSVARPTTTHEVYIQYVLEAALVPAYTTALQIAQKYRKAPYFAGVLESLLYRAVTNDEDEGETSLAVQLIGEFPEQNVDAIVSGCARKVEMKYWPRLFEAIGKSPSQLFDECLERGDLETANEFLIVVQTTSKESTPADGPDGRSASGLDLHGRTLKLYKAAASLNQFWICRQLCEFIMAVDPAGSLLREFRSLVVPGP